MVRKRASRVYCSCVHGEHTSVPSQKYLYNENRRLFLDNYSTHKHDDVTEWLVQHPRFHMHYTPTSSSWLNLVERWFRELTQKRLRRGNFIDVKDLITAIKEYLAQNNKQPKPFIWTATAQQIIDKVGRCKGISETLH